MCGMRAIYYARQLVSYAFLLCYYNVRVAY